MSDGIIKGTPTPLLLSAQRWGWKHVSGPHSIDLPFSMEVFAGDRAISTSKAVMFNVSSDITTHINFGSLVKMMFTEKVYPKLKENEMFSLSDILIDKEGATITVVGNIIERVIA